MTGHADQASLDKPGEGTFHVLLLVEPWECWMAEECVVQARDYTEKVPIPHRVEPVGSGIFRLHFNDTAEVKSVFEVGRAEVRVIDQQGNALGSRRIAKYNGPWPCALKMRIMRPMSDRAPVQISGRSNAIISDTIVHQLAQNLDRLQRVGFRSARAPRRVVQAIQELNHIAELAAYSRVGGELAQASLRTVLSSSAFESPGGPSGNAGVDATPFGDVGGSGAGGRMTMLDGPVDLGAQFRCGPALARAAAVLDSAFILDMKERNVTARWTEQACAYVSSRLRDVSGYAGSAGRAARERGGSDDYFPPGHDELTIPVLPPGEVGRDPPPSDPFEEGFGSDFCATVAEMCLSLYAEVLAAQLGDTYTDLIAVVEPNCLCSNYNPNQIFIARPQPGRFFVKPLPKRVQQLPQGLQGFWSASLPIGVVLRFGGQVLTPIRVTPDEIHFRIPPNAHSGPVYLEALGSRPSEAVRKLTNACGLGLPEIPAEIVFDRSPAAHISIIYPPVIASLTSDKGQRPAEACTKVRIRWQAHLLDRPANIPLPPCGSIVTILRDEQGNQIAVGGASGEALEERSETVAYTLEAFSQAGAVQCGTAAPISLTIAREKFVWLERQGSTGMEHHGGTGGQFSVHISCPAPGGGQQIELTSDDPALLQVPSPVIIPEGKNALLVEFGTTEGCAAAPIRVAAASAGHMPRGHLEYLIYDRPALEWASGPPAYVPEGGPFSAEVNASCVPDDGNRVYWWLISTDPNNLLGPIPVKASRPSGNYPALRFRVELDSASAVSLAPGNWELVVEIPDRSTPPSDGLGFTVAPRAKFTMTLTGDVERTVEWDEEAEYALVVTGQDIPPLVNASVAITALDLPPGFTTSTVPVAPVALTLTEANSGMPQNAALRLRSPVGRGPVGSFPRFSIQASAMGVLAPPAIKVRVTVKRQPGNFTRVDPLYGTAMCSNAYVSVNATLGGDGVTTTVTLEITKLESTEPNRMIREQVPAIFYYKSPNCRIALMIPPTVPGYVALYNIGFDPNSGVSAALGKKIKGWPALHQTIWFSKDDSLMVIIGKLPQGANDTHSANLYDTLTGEDLAREPFSPATLTTTQDPQPLVPPAWMTNTPYAKGVEVTYSALTYLCEVAHTSTVFDADMAAGKWVAQPLGPAQTAMAVVTGIVLANHSSGDVVTVNYKKPGGGADSIELRL